MSNQADQSDNANEPMMPAETLRERVEADGRLWKMGFEEGMKSARNEALASVKALLAEYEKDDQEHLSTFGQHHPYAGWAADHLREALTGEV